MHILVSRLGQAVMAPKKHILISRLGQTVMATKKGANPHKRKNKDWNRHQGCQIFLDAMYQNGGKYIKLPLNYQMAMINTRWP
jgi:hypothetical protein